MDIKEFAKELSEATKDMSDEQRATVRKMFEKVADQLDAPVASIRSSTGSPSVSAMNRLRDDAKSIG